MATSESLYRQNKRARMQLDLDFLGPTQVPTDTIVMIRRLNHETLQQDIDEIVENDSRPPSVEGWTPLHGAAKAGRNDTISVLLCQGAPMDAADVEGRTPLHVAVMYRHRATVDFLIRCGAQFRAVTKKNLNALYMSMFSRDPIIVEMLLRCGLNVNETITDPLNSRLLRYIHVAVELGEAEMVENLLKAGSEVNVHDSAGDTPLHIAARLGYAKVAKVLLGFEANVSSKDYRGHTPMSVSIQSGCSDITRMILQHVGLPCTADSLFDFAVDQGDDELLKTLAVTNNCPANLRPNYHSLLYAIEKKKFDLLESMLSKGTFDYSEVGSLDVELFRQSRRRSSAKEELPLHMAVRKGCSRSVDILLRYGACPNELSNERETALHLAIAYDRRFLFDNLATGCRNVDAVNGAGKTPLHFAIELDSRRLVYTVPEQTFFAKLLSLGADANVRVTSTGESPLDLSVILRSPPFVRMLLRRGARVNSQNALGQTALHLAMHEGLPASIDLLLDYGADCQLLDLAGKSPLNYAGSRETLHVVTRNFFKRGIAGLCHLDMDAPVDPVFRMHCELELNAMAVAKLCDGVSFLDFLCGNQRSLIIWAQREDVVGVFNGCFHVERFPIYADVLEHNLELGLRLAPLIDDAASSLNALANYRLCSLPLETILSFCSPDDMKNLIDAASISGR